MQITVELQGTVVQTLALTGESLTIGRLPDNGLTLTNPMVSKRHAELRRTPEGVTLTDLESTSGTFVSGELLLPHQPRLLDDGTEFRIGPFRLVYRLVQSSDGEGAETGGQGEETTGGQGEGETASEIKQETREVEHLVVATNGHQATTNEQFSVPNAQFSMLNSAPREHYPARYANGTGSRYLLDLPMIFHDNDFLGRYLQIFETIWETLEQRQDYIWMYFDPRSAPEPMLGWLASWLDVALRAHWPEARRRALAREATELYRWRGTRYGLTRMIEVCTGLTPEIEDTDPFVFRVRLAIPPNTDVDPALVEELIRAHKPAHAGYILEVRS